MLPERLVVQPDGILPFLIKVLIVLAVQQLLGEVEHFHVLRLAVAFRYLLEVVQMFLMDKVVLVQQRHEILGCYQCILEALHGFVDLCLLDNPYHDV